MKKIVCLVAGIMIIVLLYIWGFSLQTVYYDVNSEKSIDIKVIFISDLHNCTYGGKDQSGIIDEIEKANPDLVLFGGDVIDHVNGTQNALTLMKSVVEKYPCAYASGNHESYRDDIEQFFDDVGKTGVPVLDKDFIDLNLNNCKVRVYGIDDSAELPDVTTDDQYYNILLLHEPQHISEYNGKFDLVLSGHAHGGQWRLPIILEQGLYAPDQGIFPEYTNGQYQYEYTCHIISRGLARQLRTILIPRIFNRPELSVINVS